MKKDTVKNLQKKIEDFGAYKTGIVEVEKIKFDKSFRDICAANTCGKYGRSWTCPPGVGDIDVLIKKATEFDCAIVYQTVNTIEDSFDIEGMLEAGKKHNDLSIKIIKMMKESKEYELEEVLHLGAGGCRLCEKCGKIDNKPCVHPEYAIASLEAYGISVYDMAKESGMNYTNGTNTVTYFGAVFLKADTK